MTIADVVVATSYAILLGAVVAEVAWRRWRGDQQVLRSARTAAAMGAGSLVVGLAYTAAFTGLWRLVATFRVPGLASMWRTWPVLGFAATFVAWDLSGYVYHWLGHRTRWGWAAHQPHHSGPGYDLTVGLRQSWAPFHGLLHHPLLALLGFDLGVIVVCSAVSNCWQVLQHTSAPVAFPAWFSAHVMTPAAHRTHHGRGAGAVNLGPVFTWWDRLAGTWAPARPVPAAYGTGVSGGVLAIELAGWRAVLRR